MAHDDVGSKSEASPKGHRVTQATEPEVDEEVMPVGDASLPPLAAPRPAADELCGMVGQSPAMRHVFRLVRKVAPTEATVLIIGESGTGKELIAQAIHACSARRQQELIAVNCGAIPDKLIDSELFGHEQGAFTGATQSRAGVFERADGGTLFLDEITEMPAELQTRLLRVLETGKLRRVGGNREINVNCRVIAATNRSPQRAVEDGKLREDLFYRLSVFPINVPPLRHRTGDAPLLAQHFVRQLDAEFGEHKRLSDDAVAFIGGALWPGNIRQLKNAIYRAYILADGPTIHLYMASGEHPAPPGTPGAPGIPGSQDQLTLAIGVSMEEAERRLITATLAYFGGDKARTATVLGMSLRTLYSRLRLYRQQDQPDPA